MFTKLFSSILSSSIWNAPDHVRLVWITLLAMADKDGKVFGSRGGIAYQARVTQGRCLDALKVLSEPDEDSRTPDHEGRRIFPIEGGFQLVNYQKYRELGQTEAAREYFRMKKQESRCQRHVKDTVVLPASASASESVLEKSEKPFTRPTLEQVKLVAAKAGLPDIEADKFFDHYESNGWKVGRNPMRSLGSAIANWKRNWQTGTYANNTTNGSKGVDRNKGTYNAGTANLYANAAIKAGK